MAFKRKIYSVFSDWKRNWAGKRALLVQGARRIGKSTIVEEFGKNEYKTYILINFQTDLYKVEELFKNDISDLDTFFRNLSLIYGTKLYERESLIIFDEVQLYPLARQSIKQLVADGRYDFIETGSLISLRQNVDKILIPSEEKSVNMYPMDFEEFLWAKGYKDEVINEMLECMVELRPLSKTMYDVMLENFKEYMVIGGMPAIVSKFIENKNYSGILKMQQQILLDYEEDITKYAGGLDQSKILTVYKNIPVFLGNENKKFQITKIQDGARNREYIGVLNWLDRAGIVNISYALDDVCLPLKGNYNPNNYRIYFGDTGLLIGSLDEEAQEDLRKNQNFNTYKGAVYENVVADMLVKQGYNLYFYKSEKGTVEMDFFIRDINSLVPIEVKANDNRAVSLNNLIDSNKYKDIKYGIKLCNKNIGFNGKFYTFPYFMGFLLKRYMQQVKY